MDDIADYRRFLTSSAYIRSFNKVNLNYCSSVSSISSGHICLNSDSGTEYINSFCPINGHSCSNTSCLLDLNKKFYCPGTVSDYYAYYCEPGQDFNNLTALSNKKYLTRSQYDCNDCPMGQYSNATSGCLPCSAGTYNDKTRSSTCLSCPSGKTSIAGASSCFSITPSFTSSLLPSNPPVLSRAPTASFTISSSAFAPYGNLPDTYNCNTDSSFGGVNPPFQWVNSPSGTKSFALLMRDFQADGNGNQVSAGDDWGLYVSLYIY